MLIAALAALSLQAVPWVEPVRFAHRPGWTTGASGTGSGSYLTFLTNAYGSAAPLSVVSSHSSAGGGSSGVGSVAATAGSPGGESGSGTGQTGQDVADTTKQQVSAAKRNAESSTTYTNPDYEWAPAAGEG